MKELKYPFGTLLPGSEFWVALEDGRLLSTLQNQMISNSKVYCLRHGLDWTFETTREKRGGKQGVKITRVK